MIKRITLLLATAIAIISCGEGEKREQRLTQQNDSLRMENLRLSSEFDAQLELINKVQEGFNQIRMDENYLLTIEGQSSETRKSNDERITAELRFVTEILQRNKAQIDSMQTLLQKNGTQSKALKKTIFNLSTQLNEKTKVITKLQQLLAKRNIQIAELDKAVSGLYTSVEDLSQTNAQQEQVIDIQDQEINRAFYCYGTLRELRNEHILRRGKVLAEGFNTEYFMEIDIRTTTDIPLFAKRAKMLTNHPKDSYILEKNDEGSYGLKIINANAFWSLTKYLVIQVS